MKADRMLTASKNCSMIGIVQTQLPPRIENGRRTGQLSWREYRFLRREQARIGYDERRAKSDGYVSSYERRRLNRELDESSRNIHRLKHNDQVLYVNAFLLPLAGTKACVGLNRCKTPRKGPKTASRGRTDRTTSAGCLMPVRACPR